MPDLFDFLFCKNLRVDSSGNPPEVNDVSPWDDIVLQYEDRKLAKKLVTIVKNSRFAFTDLETDVGSQLTEYLGDELLSVDQPLTVRIERPSIKHQDFHV